jgi:EAL domain-containing protein (putative c-di-GMP-specific phosphodiesterase class I)
VDILKIDKSFVDGVSRRGKERELAESIIELGHSLSLEIVAEGVEHAEQLGWLKTHRCAFGQGFYFSEPVDPSVVDDILRRNDAARPAA